MGTTAEIIVGSILFRIMIMLSDEKMSNSHNYEVPNSCGSTM